MAMREEDDSYLKPGMKDENEGVHKVGRPKPIKPMPVKPGGPVKKFLPKPAKPGDGKKRALREAMLKSQSKSSSPKPKSGLDNTWM